MMRVNTMLLKTALVSLMLSVSFGQTTSIYDVQYTTDASGDSPLKGTSVTISGIVTAEFWGSSSERYINVQDAAGPWNGIMVFEYGGWDSFDFQGPGGVVHSIAEGDSVTLTGTVDEYYGMTEIKDVTAFTIHGPAVNKISPSTVTPGQIKTGGTDAEAYEGCLVRVADVSVGDPDLGYGEWTVTDGTDSVRVDDRWDYYYWPEAAQALTEVVGCLDYSYSNNKIMPRLARDIVEKGTIRIQRIQQVLYSDLLKAGDDSASDTSYFSGDTVSLEGIVTMPTGLSYAGAGVKFIYEDVHGGPWSGILSYDPDSSAFPVLFEGDRILATGYISEYSTGPANMTELFITQPVDILDTGNDLPAADTIATGDLRWPTEAEQWGNVMVVVKDVTVTDNQLQYEIFAADDGSGAVLVDDDSDSIDTYFSDVGPPPEGTFIKSIRGWVYHHYGSYSDSSAYKLEPLYVSDFVFGSGPPNISNVSRDPCVPDPSEVVTVTCEISDNSTVASAAIMVSVDGGAYASVAMTPTSGTLWEGIISATTTEGARVSYYVVATDDGGDQGEVKSGMDPSDITVNQYGYVTKTGPLTVKDIQYTDWPLGDSPFNGCTVTVTGIITGDTAQYSSGYGAYALQSESGPWNGIVFDSWDGSELILGDDVTVIGTVEEYDPSWHFKYDGNTKLINVTSVTVNSSGNNLEPFQVSTADLAQDAEEVESYEGCLVTIPSVIISAVNSYDWSIMDVSGIPCLIDDDMATAELDDFMSSLEVNDGLKSVTGIFNYSFGSYKIQLRNIDDMGELSVDDIKPLPHKFALYQNYPNPFNPQTSIRFDLAGDGPMQLIIYDVLGRQVRTLADASYSAGIHVLNWNGKNDQGLLVGSGVYIYRMQSRDFLAYKKMLLVR